MMDIDEAIALLRSALDRPATDVADRARLDAALGALDRIAEASQAGRTALAESEERLRLAVAAARMGTWDHDERTGRLHWNRRQREIFGVDPEGEVNESVFLARLHPEDRDRVYAAAAAARDPAQDCVYDIEYRLLHPDGSIAWVRARGRALFDGEGPDRRPRRFIGTTVDVTERKQAEAAMADRLAEREAMLREIHHRVRNNLQVVWSLLRLESSRLPSGAERDHFDRLAERISAFGNIHQRIAEAEALSLSVVDLGPYLHQVTERIARQRNARPQSWSVTADQLACTLDAAIPLALIADELIDDAFQPDSDGLARIEVTLSRKGRNSVVLSVRCRRTFPAARDPARSLVTALAQQIDARFEMDTTDGATDCRLTAPSRLFRSTGPTIKRKAPHGSLRAGPSLDRDEGS
ncbi:sensor histidine kinase [Arenibaculum pallidiluteum]|uniref:sensor histidine kinase n=1 Tax=Arenibaculum pallidiluteum TaxID=2812559 RepID=UPI001A958003|nr:PAS domain-containing protein [Arenibaculum pallidiluteum]